MRLHRHGGCRGDLGRKERLLMASNVCSSLCGRIRGRCGETMGLVRSELLMVSVLSDLPS